MNRTLTTAELLTSERAALNVADRLRRDGNLAAAAVYELSARLCRREIDARAATAAQKAA